MVVAILYQKSNMARDSPYVQQEHYLHMGNWFDCHAALPAIDVQFFDTWVATVF